MYPLQVHQFVLVHALDVVQVEVEDVFLFVVVGVFLVVVVVVGIFLFPVVMVVIFLVVVVIVVIFLIIVIFLIDGRRHTGHFSLDGG